MAAIDDLLFRLSNFYDLFPDADRAYIKALWSGYGQAVTDLYLQLYAIDQAKSIETITPSVRREWFPLELSYNTAVGPSQYTINPKIVSIPQLQNRVTVPTVSLIDGTDYTLVNGTLTFTSAGGIAAAAKTLRVVDSLGNRLPAGVVADTNLGGLSGVDYSWAGGNAPISLYSKAAFDRFAATEDPEIIQTLLGPLLWAPDFFLDEGLVYQNFGYYLELPPEEAGFSLATYTRVVQGLWFVVWNGPTPRNIRSGLSLVFDYPTAPEAGTVLTVESQTTWSGTAFITVDTVIIETTDGRRIPVEIPPPFRAVVVAGETVRKYNALSDAVQVFDELANPGWWSFNLPLSRFVENDPPHDQVPTAVKENSIELLKHFNAGIRLKLLESTDLTLETRSRLVRTAARFLEIIRPVYARFTFLSHDEIVATAPDTVSLGETSFSADFGGEGLFALLLHPTVGHNVRNQLVPPDEVRSPAPFTSLGAYQGSGSGTPAYNLGADTIKLRDSLDVVVESNARPDPQDLLAPRIFHDPIDGIYPDQFYANIAAQDLHPLVVTFDGSQPVFGDPLAVPTPIPQVGVRVLGPVLIPRGTRIVKARAKNGAGVIGEAIIEYVIPEELAITTTQPPAQFSGIQAKSKTSLQVRFLNSDPTTKVFYSTDGKAPTDTVFAGAERLNELRLELVGATAVRVSDHTLPIDFASGRSVVNREGSIAKVIQPVPFTRYFAYAEKLGDSSWRLNFTKYNTTIVPDSDNSIRIGFVIANGNGLFTPEGLINAVDASPTVNEAINDPFFSTGALSGAVNNLQTPNPMNSQVPVALSSQAPVNLRYFGRHSLRQDMFEVPQSALYEFDTIPPKTTIKSSLTTSPFFRTLVVEFATDTPGSNICYSTETTAPTALIFGFPEKFIKIDDLTATITTLRLQQTTTPNQVKTNVDVFDLSFQRSVAGIPTTINTTDNANPGQLFSIPLSPVGAFYDFIVTADANLPGKWRVERGAPNVPSVETPDRLLLARVKTDSTGALNALQGRGQILTAGTNPTNTTRKYTAPILLDASAGDFEVKFAFFALDPQGNAETTQIVTLKPHAT